MQIIVYKIANNTLFIDKIEERGGEKYFLSFPEEIKGKCHIGKHIVPIKDGRCEITFPLSRTMYPVWIEGEDCRYEGEGILYKDGRFHRAREEELSRAFFEIAVLKDTIKSLKNEVRLLTDAVFHTVIF